MTSLKFLPTVSAFPSVSVSRSVQSSESDTTSLNLSASVMDSTFVTASARVLTSFFCLHIGYCQAMCLAAKRLDQCLGLHIVQSLGQCVRFSFLVLFHSTSRRVSRPLLRLTCYKMCRPPLLVADQLVCRAVRRGQPCPVFRNPSGPPPLLSFMQRVDQCFIDQCLGLHIP